MHLRTSLTAVAGAALLATTLTGCQPPRAWHNELLTYDASGTHSANDASGQPVLSPDGTQLAFVSQGYDFGPPDDYRFTDVYLRDLATGEITMVSHNADGTSGGNHDSFSPVFSPDGTKIAFESWAYDLGPNDTNAGHEGPDIYLYDVATGTNSLVSVNAAGTNSGSIGSSNPVFSPDGTRIAFS
ncbi:MAG TPA: hypothetical protein VGO78_06755, partial [Acidimicrobiales bacterium]|nr:hypothetical protein [Acidimicrobiales bacterium]